MYPTEFRDVSQDARFFGGKVLRVIKLNGGSAKEYNNDGGKVSSRSPKQSLDLGRGWSLPHEFYRLWWCELIAATFEVSGQFVYLLL